MVSALRGASASTVISIQHVMMVKPSPRLIEGESTLKPHTTPS